MPTRDSPKVTVRLEPHERDALHSYAEDQGTTLTALARAYLLGLVKLQPTPARRSQTKQ